jgi:hypothetical protein
MMFQSIGSLKLTPAASVQRARLTQEIRGLFLNMFHEFPICRWRWASGTEEAGVRGKV